jgi:hypothetical protein
LLIKVNEQVYKNKNQPIIARINTNLDFINFTNLRKTDKIRLMFLELLKLVIIRVIRGKKRGQLERLFANLCVIIL